MKVVLAMMAILAAGAGAKLSASEAQAFSAIRSTLDRQMIDYPSARFREARIASYQPFVVCGLVNARNRSGGFTGWQNFTAVYREGEAVVMIAEQQDMMMKTACGMAPLSPPPDLSGELTYRQAPPR